MTERAEGFWWVRWASGPDEVAEVVSWKEYVRRVGFGAHLNVGVNMVRTRLGWSSTPAAGLTWGPYLGKEPARPGHTERCGTAYRGCAPECTFEAGLRCEGERPVVTASVDLDDP